MLKKIFLIQTSALMFREYHFFKKAKLSLDIVDLATSKVNWRFTIVMDYVVSPFSTLLWSSDKLEVELKCHCHTPVHKSEKDKKLFLITFHLCRAKTLRTLIYLHFQFFYLILFSFLNKSWIHFQPVFHPLTLLDDLCGETGWGREKTRNETEFNKWRRQRSVSVQRVISGENWIQSKLRSWKLFAEV